MKINIIGNDVTPENVAEALKTCERDYKLKIKNITLYVRYEDENGKAVEPTHLGEVIIREFTFNRTKEISLPATEPINVEEMKKLIETNIGRTLVSSEIKKLVFLFEQGVDKETFLKMLYFTIDKKSKFSMYYLEKAIIANMQQKQKTRVFRGHIN